jgi:pimeloyl-ACP methyl ester carboxylesterase
MSFDGAFAERDVRVVTIDRPGYGGSSPQPGRRLESWPADAATVVDELGADRFAVTGFSTGGLYAVACAALLPDRVVGAGVLAGVSDFAWPGAWQGYLESEGAVMRMSDLPEAVAWCEAHYGTDGSGFLKGGLGELAPADRAALADEALGGALVASVIEGFRHGVAGYAQDVLVQGRGWPFDPATITAPLVLVHGEADTVVPLGHPRHTAEVVATATLHTRPGGGHMSVLLEIPVLAAEVSAALR